MRVSLHHYTPEAGWDEAPGRSSSGPSTLLVLFAPARPGPSISDELERLAVEFADSVVIGCSTAGQIMGDFVDDRSIAVARIDFDKTRLRLVSEQIDNAGDSLVVGQRIAAGLREDGLKAVLTFTDGLRVNGSAYVRGLGEALPADVVVTGGMAADGDLFERTWVTVDGRPRQHAVVACGFYGSNVRVGHASRGGWDLLGIDRQVTRSEGNVLYSLDHQPALVLYKRYLGDRASGLPGTGLLFPLALLNREANDGLVVRTILAVDEQQQSITFAGDIPQGARVRLMRGNFERIIDAAALAGESLQVGQNVSSAIVIAISCVGRRLLLGARTADELEAVKAALPGDIGLLGFYSYGEISPLASGRVDLHNQTMTLTFIAEN